MLFRKNVGEGSAGGGVQLPLVPEDRKKEKKEKKKVEIDRKQKGVWWT